MFKVVKKTKQELVAALLSISIVARGTKDEVIQIATANNLEVEVTIERVNEGWTGRPKVLLQVLWERGFADESSLKSYSKKGAKDNLGFFLNSLRLIV